MTNRSECKLDFDNDQSRELFWSTDTARKQYGINPNTFKCEYSPNQINNLVNPYYCLPIVCENKRTESKHVPLSHIGRVVPPYLRGDPQMYGFIQPEEFKRVKYSYGKKRGQKANNVYLINNPQENRVGSFKSYMLGKKRWKMEDHLTASAAYPRTLAGYERYLRDNNEGIREQSTRRQRNRRHRLRKQRRRSTRRTFQRFLALQRARGKNPFGNWI